jgi:glycosyltransferase involved in cell wall biosynthesis
MSTSSLFQETVTSSPHPEPGDTLALPLVSVITPAFNEEAIISKNLQRIYDYMKTLEHRFRWEMIVVNDGSRDKTPVLADEFAATHENVRVIHHSSNRNLGGALMTGFKHAEGDYVIVLDLDLSYSEDHIVRLLDKIESSDADIVVASPYMKGGRNTKVPWFRLLLSKVYNRLMRLTAPTDIHTFTSMVRVYKREFLRFVNLKNTTYSINPELIQKAIILRARIKEIPAHLDWSWREEVGKTRTSSVRIFKGITAGMMTSFIFRPYALFMSIGVALSLISLYLFGWIFFHIGEVYSRIPATDPYWDGKFSAAIAQVFRDRPHLFFVAGITVIVATKVLSLGFLSLQNKRYFDELFHICTTLRRDIDKLSQS